MYHKYMNTVFLSVFLLIVCYQTVWFLISLILKRNDIADYAWGMGFVFVCFYLLLFTTPTLNLKIISLLTLIWGLRLSGHIYQRLVRSEEDSRYAQWRKDWEKTFFLRSYLQVFLLQGLFMFFISLSAITATFTKNFSAPLVILGVIVWLKGFFFESVADNQLRQFVKNPDSKGHVLQSGLWKYSRHPNYFGEVTQWWGIFLIALSSNNYLSLVSPLTITFLILFVSGVPLLEKKYQGRPEYESYKKRTSVFIPWFPKRVSS